MNKSKPWLKAFQVSLSKNSKICQLYLPEGSWILKEGLIRLKKSTTEIL